MTPKTLLVGLATIGFAACAGAQTETTGQPVYTLEDVTSAPEAWRKVDPENLVIFETSKGEIIIELLPEAAPVHVERFQAYVRSGLYDGTPFHRVIKGFMAQGGDVAQTHGADKEIGNMASEFVFRRDPKTIKLDTIGPADSASSGFYKGMPIDTQPEFLGEMSKDGMVESWIPHCPGVLSTARTDDPNSGDAQFFLISDKAQHLDYKYTAKGRALTGLDVIKAIKLGPTPNGFPIANPDVVISAKMMADLPVSEQRAAYVQRTDTQAWQEKLEAADRTRTPICSLPPVPAVIG